MTLLACAIVMSGEHIPERHIHDRLSGCVDVARRAKARGLDPLLMISISWIESRFDRRAVSRAGAVGLMQVLPRYFCPRRRLRGCDTLEAGLRAWIVWRNTTRSDIDALCRYNGGWSCGRRSRYYARAVMRTRRRVTRDRVWQIVERFNRICGDVLMWGAIWRN